MTKRFCVNVEIEVTLDLDETKFTPEFMEKYNITFSNLNDIQDHAKGLSWQYATSRISGFDDFIEGYGPAKGMGIKFVYEADAVLSIIDEEDVK